jgi:hypothetical protein
MLTCLDWYIWSYNVVCLSWYRWWEHPSDILLVNQDFSWSSKYKVLFPDVLALPDVDDSENILCRIHANIGLVFTKPSYSPMPSVRSRFFKLTLVPKAGRWTETASLLATFFTVRYWQLTAAFPVIATHAASREATWWYHQRCRGRTGSQ